MGWRLAGGQDKLAAVVLIVFSNDNILPCVGYTAPS